MKASEEQVHKRMHKPRGPDFLFHFKLNISSIFRKGNGLSV